MLPASAVQDFCDWAGLQTFAHHGLVGHSEYVVVVVLWVVRQGCRGQDGERGTRGEGERREELTRSDDM